MRVREFHSFVVMAALFISSQAMAAGIGSPQSYCRIAEGESELINYQSVSLLRAEVYRRYEHAAEVSKSNQAIYTQSALFLWANEAKISCAKVYGSLRKPWQWRRRPDYTMLQKCECFYQRMTQYLGH